MQIGSIRNGDKGVYVGRPSPLANPFVLFLESERETVIKRYRGWLYEQIMSGDKKVLDALRSLKDDDTLVCWCFPLPCHAEIIISAWEWAKGKGLLDVPV